jgi:hypothetical protein
MIRGILTLAIAAGAIAAAIVVTEAPPGATEADKKEPSKPDVVAEIKADAAPATNAQAAPADSKAASSPKVDNAKTADGAKTSAAEPNLLQTVGALAAAHYFQTYLNIGFIADGKGHGIYSEKDARRVLQSVLSVLDSVDRRLETLGQVNLNKDDRDSLEQMRAISALLRQQARELQTYWERGQDEDLARYETIRKNSYAAISKLLGIGQ